MFQAVLNGFKQQLVKSSSEADEVVTMTVCILQMGKSRHRSSITKIAAEIQTQAV